MIVVEKLHLRGMLMIEFLLDIEKSLKFVIFAILFSADNGV